MSYPTGPPGCLFSHLTQAKLAAPPLFVILFEVTAAPDRRRRRPAPRPGGRRGPGRRGPALARGDGAAAGAGPAAIAVRERLRLPGRDARLRTVTDVDVGHRLRCPPLAVFYRWQSCGLLDSWKILDSPGRPASNRLETANRQRDIMPTPVTLLSGSATEGIR